VHLRDGFPLQAPGFGLVAGRTHDDPLATSVCRWCRSMNFAEARAAVLGFLRENARAKNSEMLQVLGGDTALWEQVREDLLFHELAVDVRGAGLAYTGPSAPSAVPVPGPEQRVTASSESGPAAGRTVFISYGRADALGFARRLADDLAQRGGYRVWMDLSHIEEGGLFEVRIEQGIRAASVVVAVMTRHSLREGSICRDEVVFALNEGKPVVPLRVDPDPQLKPPLLLARRNWIDFTQDYEESLASLLRYLAGDERALRPPLLPTVTGVVPLDSGPEIARFSAGFTGRGWLNREIDAWLEKPKGRAFVIVGEPGVGKSAIAAWLTQVRRGQVVGVHFCTQRNTRTLNPFEFVASAIAQLCSQLPGYAEAVEGRHPEMRRSTASDAFRELIVEPTRSMPAPCAPMLMVVDSLDEAATQEGETVVDVLVQQAVDLPAWLRIITTTRPEEPILRRIRQLSPFELKAERAENLADLAVYIDQRLRAAACAARVGPDAVAVARRLAELAGGNFLCAAMAADALEDGTLAVTDLGRLAPGLAEFYATTFAKRFPDVDGYARDVQPVLRALSVALAPLPIGLLQRVTGTAPEEVNRLLLVLKPYLRTSVQGGVVEYALFHKSLRDWLGDAAVAGSYWCEPTGGHRQLAENLLRSWREDQYALRYLPAHLASAQDWDRLADLLTNAAFLEAKNAAGMIFDLAADCTAAVASLPEDRPQRRILRLLDEALRRDIHFIARHAQDYPQALLQCLWNSCWWYDSPEAARHYAQPRGGRRESKPPWERPGPKACAVVESWRRLRPSARSGLTWLRSLRPPPLPLGSPQQAVLRGHEHSVTSVAFSPDGQQVVSGSKDGMARVWDARNGAELAVLRGHERGVTSVAVSPDGRRIVTGSGDGKVRLWDAQNWAELAVLSGHARDVNTVACSWDGGQIASGSGDRTVRLWDSQTGTPVAVLQGHEEWIWSVAFSCDGRRIVSGSLDKTVRVWDTRNASQVAVLRGHDGMVSSVAFSPDGRQIVSGGDQTVRVWDAQSGAALAVWRGHESDVRSVAVSPNGRQIVSGSLDQTVRVWDAGNGAQLAVLRGHEGWTNSVAFSPDGRRIASGSNDTTVRLWDTESEDELAVLHGHEQWVNDVAFSPDGRQVLSNSTDHTLRVWDADSGEELAVLRGHERGVLGMAFSADGRRIVSGSGDHTVRVWDSRSGAALAVLRGHVRSVLAVDSSSDGRWVVSGSVDETVRVWDAERGTELAVLRGHERGVPCVVLSPDGRRIASGSNDKTVRIWDTFGGTELAVLRGHKRSVTTVVFSRDGARIASGSLDQTVRVWDAASGTELAVLGGHEGAIQSVAFSLDGRRIVTRSGLQSLHVWDAESGRCLKARTGYGGAAAVARSLSQPGYHILIRGQETALAPVDREEPTAYFPVVFEHIATHPSGRRWAGAVANQLYLLALEDSYGSPP
jgi:WD40 repeat protein